MQNKDKFSRFIANMVVIVFAGCAMALAIGFTLFLLGKMFG